MAHRFRRNFVLAVLFVAVGALLAGPEAETAGAARYVVAQCGWHVGQDADWYDLSADKFGKSTYCQTPASADPFDGVHVLSQVKGSTSTVGGTRFATWRWQAPPGTGIVNVHGQRWQYLRNGFQHRLGGVAKGGGFSPFLSLDTSDGTKRDFGQGFSPFAEAFESRLVCRRPEDKVCEATGTIQAAVRSLTISIDDGSRPTTQIGGGLIGGGWLRGLQQLNFDDRDVGSGLRFAETYVDGNVKTRTEMSCAKELISGQWRGTRMQPCPTASSGAQTIDTRTLSDGAHTVRHCAVDFAAASGCTADRTVRVDNNAPAAPRELRVEGGDGWHRTNGFDLTWTEPNQGVGSPIVANVHRLSRDDGYRAGPFGGFAPGRIDDIRVPGPGVHRVDVALMDMAGNLDESHAASVTLRLDDVPPTGYFVDPPEGDPGLVRVRASDLYSGVAGGTISWRPASGGEWEYIPGSFVAGAAPMLSARVPADAPRGEWMLRAAIVDRAGNLTVTEHRANGSTSTIETPFRTQTSLLAGLGKSSSGSASSVLVGYGRRAWLGGRLVAKTGGGGIGGQELVVTESPLPGSRRGQVSHTVRTDERGDFGLWLGAGPGRRVDVEFPGSRRLEGSASPTLELRVSGRVKFHARPKRLRTGKRVRFWGRVAAAGAWHPRSGNLVQIQYFEESARRWRPVVLIRTRRGGRFKTRYRFRYITGTARIRLRALLVPSSRFPYGGAASKPVAIRVRG